MSEADGRLACEGLVLIEQSQNSQCIAVCYCNQSRCPCRLLSTTTETQSNGAKWPSLINHIFHIPHMDGCTSLALRTHGTRMHYGKKASLQRLELQRSANHANLDIHIHPDMAKVFLDVHGLYQQEFLSAPCHKAKMAQEQFKDHNTKLEVMTCLLDFPDITPVFPTHRVLPTSWCLIPQHV